MSQGLRVLALSLSAASMCMAPAAFAQWASARGALAAPALAPSYQDDYGDWRQQVRVASPSRNARWNAAPAGAVRVYHRRFDARWNWRSAPRHRVVYTYYRGDLWFLDPTTGWAYSVDRYGIVYTADPYRGWVYSLGPLTRWTADLLYFFDLYRFDRGYWSCRDYDYFVDLWEDYPRYGYYTYDTAYRTLWDWEPYFRSPTFITYSNRFSTVWIRQVRSHYDYIERNPHYRRELVDSIGLPAVQAVPPRLISPRAVATTAYWEARDLAAAGLAAPPRGRDTGRGYVGVEAGTIIDARQSPSQVVEPGAPAPGFNAPFPNGTYGFGVRPGGTGLPGESDGRADGRGRDEGAPLREANAETSPADATSAPGASAEVLPPPQGGRGRGREESGRVVEPDERGVPARSREEVGSDAPPPFEEPEAPPQQPSREDSARFEHPRETARFGRDRDDGRNQAPAEQPRFEAPPREEPQFEAPPREEPRYEEPQREEPRYEEPQREEPQREEPQREEPQREEPQQAETREERQER